MFRSKPVVLMLVIVALLGLPLSGVLAQGGEMPPVYCGDLSAEDCAILEQSQVAMMEVASSAVNMRADMAFSGIDEEIDGFAMSLLVDGAFAADPEIMQSFTQTPSPDALSEMLAQGLTVMVDVLRGVQGEADVQIVLPAELAAEAGIPMDTLATTLVMVDGVLYVNLESLIPAEAMGEGEMQMPAWIGLDLAGMYEMMAEMPMDEMGGDMEELQELMSSEEFAGMYDYENWGEFMTITRLDDAEVDGQPMAVFNIVLDYESIFSSEAFQESFSAYMNKVMEMQGADAEELPDNFMEVMTAMMSGMSLEMNQWIGLSDFYMYHFDMAFDFTIDPETIAALEPEAAEGMSTTFSMSMQMSADSTAFNEPVEVTAPADAQVINPAMFMQMAPETAG